MTSENESEAAEKVLAIVGPTAVGKTAVSVEIASAIDAEIVSADSMAVYRGMDIGTAKPTPAERRRAKFHLIDVVDPSEGFSAGRFEPLALAAIRDIAERGRTALLVGGTGLYVRAVLDGLDTGAAPPNPDIRAKLVEEAEAKGNEALLERLRRIDFQTGSRLSPNDLKRIVRALEIYEITGRPASEVYRSGKDRKPNLPNALMFGLTMDRAALYARVEARIDRQMAEGLVDEVRRLLESGVGPECIAMQGLGYKEMARHLQGELGLDEAVELFKRNTRRFAKRQLTWFRADRRIRWIDVTELSPRRTADMISKEAGAGSLASKEPA